MGGNSEAAQVVAIDQCLNVLDPMIHTNQLRLYIQDCVDLMQVYEKKII